jgi:Domain of unknown function (DUF1883)
MKFLHYEFHLNRGDVVEITLDNQANVKLMSDWNFRRYRNQERHEYYGGLQTRRVQSIVAPDTDHWNLTIDRGGYGGTVRASVRVIS